MMPKKIWVSSLEAKIKAEQAASSETVAVLPKGAPLSVLEKDGKWYRVKTEKGVSGWVYRGKISTEQPSAESGSSENLIGDLASSDIRAGGADSSRSIRGLSPETKVYADESGTPEAHRKELDRLLSFRVETGDIEKFLKKGGIGEFAE